MKLIFIIISFFVFFTSESQIINYDNFDKKLFEKILFDKINNFRKKNNLDTLYWSNILYSEITSKQLKIIVKENRLFHPDLYPIWVDSNRLRNELSKESESKFKVKTLMTYFDGPRMSITENLFRCQNLDVSYQELADIAIKSWDESIGHRMNQRMIYSCSKKPGLTSCAVEVIPNSKIIYIGINYVNVSRY